MRVSFADRRPPTYSKQALLEWLRNEAPDLRILRGIVDGNLVVATRFTFNGQLHEYNAVAGEQPNGTKLLDPEDAVIRTSCLAIMRELGMPVARRGRTELEREILAATARGDTAHAENLGRDLVMRNQEELRLRTNLRSRFGRRQAW
jgi:hypothetical protein